jgi:tripartite-type tricarboxylate transporter receptor subunit TctC
MNSLARGSLFFTISLSVIAGLPSPEARADDGWPARPIRLIIPYAAGGAGDATFRQVAPIVEKRLGQPFVIENKPGAGGNIGAAEVSRAAPDGYTLLLGATNNFVTNQFLYKMGFDPLKTFAPITVMSNAPTVVTVHPSLPVKTLKELAEYAKANPGKLNYSSPGIGTPAHLAAEYFSSLADVKMVHVPYRGGAPAAMALAANDVQVFFTPFTLIAGLVQKDAVRMLAVAAPNRMPFILEIPTTGEAGFPDLLTGNWWGFVAPVGTDKKILDKLNTEFAAALKDREVQQRYGQLGMIAVGNTPAEFGDMLKSEAARWKKVIDAAGITPQ